MNGCTGSCVTWWVVLTEHTSIGSIYDFKPFFDMCMLGCQPPQEQTPPPSHPRVDTPPEQTATPADRCASYWNAFLFLFRILIFGGSLSYLIGVIGATPELERKIMAFFTLLVNVMCFPKHLTIGRDGL